MSNSLNVTLPVVAMMNGENPIINVTVFPLSPLTLSVSVDASIVVVSLWCIPSNNVTLIN